MSATATILAAIVGTALATIAGLATTALWRALVAIAGLPAAVDALRDAVDRLATVPPRIDRLEAAVFPQGVPAS